MNEAMANHCISVYSYMEARQEYVQGFRRYDGSPTKVFDELGISRTYYSLVWKYLEEGGFISRTGRGTGVLLHSRPTIDQLLLTELPERDTIPFVRRIEALEAALGGLDIVGILTQLDHRITAIENAHKGTNQGENTE
jgi:hypothetical protein